MANLAEDNQAFEVPLISYLPLPMRGSRLKRLYHIFLLVTGRLLKCASVADIAQGL